MRTAALLLAFAASVAAAVEPLDFRVVARIPHSRSDFTQGLEIRDRVLFQGTGRYGDSRLQAFDLDSGVLLREHSLPGHIFGEGITVLDDRVIQLSWRSRRAFVYRVEDFETIEEFRLPGEGWGLANDGENLVYSDGSDTLRFISPVDWGVIRELRVRRNGKPVRYLNELEWTPRGILANVFRRDVIVRIDPGSGEVTGELDLSGLLPRSERRPGTNVLNGIARDPSDGSLLVTGKNWPWIYRIELREDHAPPEARHWETGDKTQ